MKVLIVSIDFPPKQSIASLRPYSFAKYWARNGHDVTVLTAPHNRPDDHMHLDCSSFKTIEVPLPSWSNKLRTTNTKFTAQARTKKTVEKIVELFLEALMRFRSDRGILMDQRMPALCDGWAREALIAISDTQWDLVISTYAPYQNHFVGHQLKREGRAAFWVADYRDLWTKSHLYKGLFPFNSIEKIQEQRINDAADLITTVSKPLANTLAKKLNREKIFVIENGFDPEDLKQLPSENFFEKEKIVIAYTGTIYEKIQNPEPLFKAISAIKNNCDSPSLSRLEIAMAGSCSATLHRLAAKYDVDEYLVDYGDVTRITALQMQRDATALLFLGSELSGAKGILTGKFFEYIFSGTEIICIGETKNGDCGKLILETNTGSVLGNDCQLIQRKLQILLETGKTSLITNKAKIHQFSRKALAEKLIAIAIDHNKKTIKI